MFPGDNYYNDERVREKLSGKRGVGDERCALCRDETLPILYLVVALRVPNLSWCRKVYALHYVLLRPVYCLFSVVQTLRFARERDDFVAHDKPDLSIGRSVTKQHCLQALGKTT